MSIHARLAGQLHCALASARPGAPGCGPDDPAVSAFAAQLAAPSPAAFEAYIRGITDSNDDARLRNLRDAARLQPQWDAPAFALGDAYFTRRKCEVALPWLTRIPAASARSILAGFEAGVCYLLRGDPAKAQAAFSAVARSFRPASDAGSPEQFRRGLGSRREIAEAQAAFEQATRADAEEPDYWLNLGLLHLRAQRFDAAIEPLRRAVGLQPNDAEARTLLALALDQGGRADEAQAERLKLADTSTRVVLPRNPNAADFARFDRIRMRLDPGALRPASSAPESTDVAGNRRGRQRIVMHVERGRQFLDSGNLDDAQRAFIEALLLAPLDADAHTGLAEVYDQQGRPNDGVREYRAALASRDDLTTRVALAELLVRQDRSGGSARRTQIVLGRDPDNAKAQELLEQLSNRSTSGGSP